VAEVPRRFYAAFNEYSTVSSICTYLWRVFKHARTRRRAHVCLLDIRVTSFRRIFRLPLQIATFIQRIRNVANLFRLNMLFLDGRYSRGDAGIQKAARGESLPPDGRTDVSRICAIQPDLFLLVRASIFSVRLRPLPDV